MGAGIGSNVAQSLPFIGGLLDGGRVPISAAIPDVKAIWNTIGGTADNELSAETAKDRIWKEMVKPLVFLIPPVGGGQAKKTYEGLKNVNNSGLYVRNKDGERYLKFYTHPTPATYAQAAMFGQYATPEGQEYIKGGFKPMLNPKETDAMDKLVADGVEPWAYVDLVRYLKQQKPTKDSDGKVVFSATDKKRSILFDSQNLTPEQKTMLDSLIIASNEEDPSVRNYDSENSFVISGMSKAGQELWDAPAVREVASNDAAIFAKIIEAAGDIKGDKDIYGNSISGSAKQNKINAIASNLNLSSSQAENIYNTIYLTKHTIDDFSSNQRMRFERISKATGRREQEMIDAVNLLRDVKSDDESTVNQNRIQALINSGYSKNNAQVLVKDLYSTRYAIDELSESLAEKYSNMNSLYNISEKQFLSFFNASNDVKGEKDQNGKTISGSQKRARFNAIVQLEMGSGLGRSQAEANARVFLVEAYGYKDTAWW